MGLFSSLGKLVSGSGENVSAPAYEATEYKGYLIQPSPMKDQGQYRVSATIRKGEGDDAKHHTFIRSDLVGNADECVELTLRKAKLTIDQLGDGIF